MKIGFVGLGRRGGALARRLMREHRLCVFDLRPEVRQAFAVREVYQAAINELGHETDLNELIRGCERQARVDIVPG